MPPHTTERTTTNLKKNNNQKFQKIKLYGNLTTKELKKKHSARLLGVVQTGSPGGEDSQQCSHWQTGADEAVAGGPGTVVAGRSGGATFACR